MKHTIRLKCHECGKEFDRYRGKYDKGIKEGRNYFFCSNSCHMKHRNRKLGITIPITVRQCPKCGEEFETKMWGKKSRQYCSRKCANARQHSLETRKKIGESVRRKWQDPEYAAKCTRARSHTENWTSNQARCFTSKGERELRKFFQTTYPSQNWTWGGRLIVGDLSITRDLYSDKLKTCIEYDGIWHFIDIKGRLENKQAKDAALLEWCDENGYRLIRIEDEVYKEDPSFWQERIAHEVETGSLNYTVFYRLKHTKNN